MRDPSIRTSIKDTVRDITYHVIAYRTLTRQELVLAVRHFQSSQRGKKPKRGSAITIITIIGHAG